MVSRLILNLRGAAEHSTLIYGSTGSIYCDQSDEGVAPNRKSSDPHQLRFSLDNMLSQMILERECGTARTACLGEGENCLL
jgi:hypothetical protein